MKSDTYNPKPAERATLKALDDLGPDHPVTYDDLARIINVSRGTIRNILNKLKAEGLIEVSRSKRYHWRTLTPRGREAL